MVKENEASGPPSVQKTHLCLKCGAHTDHDLLAAPAGAELTCKSCGNLTLTYTKQDMAKIVQQAMEKMTAGHKPHDNVSVPEGTRVFIDYHGAGASEKELDSHAVATHVRITGELPVPGKPMYAKGSSMPVPYGNVKRIEVPEEQKEN